MSKYCKIILSLSLFAILILFTQPILAYVELEVEFPEIGGEGLTGETKLPAVIKYVLNIFVIIAVLAVFASLIYGGVVYLGSTGNPEIMRKARKRIINSALGLVILSGSYLLLRTINPQLLILRIKKVPVIGGVVLLNKAAFNDADPNIKDIMSTLKSGTEEEIKEKVQELLDAPLDGPRAVYLGSSISDLTKMFGELQKQPNSDIYTFADFELWGLYFLPEANAKILSFYHEDFISSKAYVKGDIGPGKTVSSPIANNEYAYPDCSARGNGPCKFNLLAGTSDGVKLDNTDPDYAGGRRRTPPLSLIVKGIGRGVYLHSGKLGEEVYLQHQESVRFLRDQPYNFDDKTKKIEIKNWLEEKVDDVYKPVKKTNYLAILHEHERFEGQLRIFFERFLTPTQMISGLFGNVRPDHAPCEDTGTQCELDFSVDGDKDRYGKVEKPSSVQVFEMPQTDEEWQEWANGANGKGCVVKVCVEKNLAEDVTQYGFGNPDACAEYNFGPTFLEPQDLFDPKDGDYKVAIRIDEDGKEGWDMEADGISYKLREVPLSNNIRSLGIEGNCIVVLFERPIADPPEYWHKGSPGEHSEVFTPWSEEFEKYNGYRDLTVDNKVYEHSTGLCDCGWFRKFRKTWGTCYPCASAIAIYPVK